MADGAGLIIPIVGMMIPIVLVPSILTLRYFASKREFEHRERMKALEKGLIIPNARVWPIALVCIAIGAGVPATALIFAAVSTTPLGNQADIWIPAAMVGLAGVYAGYKLAFALLLQSPITQMPSTETTAKSYMHDPDAFDIVGTRG